jgi:hypothetical protein
MTHNVSSILCCLQADVFQFLYTYVDKQVKWVVEKYVLFSVFL